MKKAIACSLLMLACAPCISAPLGAGAFDMISISADEAREDEQPGILHFSGQFQMRSDDWQLNSAQATVYGSPDKPDRVYLEGSPAHFNVKQTDQTDQGPINGTAEVVEYLRAANLLVLSGEAVLKLGDEIIRSARIEYDISTNRYQAGGDDGVHIQVPPTN
ncbi:MAG: hypothetical protein OEU84_10110 [Xanthomonadales bacterium]|nr:hypothetical protein [Xanthomonadales bacterium]